MATKKTKKTAEPEATVMLSIRVTPDQKKRLKIASAFHGISIQELARKGVEMVLGDL